MAIETRPGDGTIDQLALAGQLRLLIARLARQLRQQTAHGLSPTQLTALAAIHKSGPVTLGALAELEQVAPPTITKVADKLQELGLIERQVDPADRRFVRVAVTTTGRETIDRMRAERDAWLGRRLDQLPPGDLERLAAAIDALGQLAGEA